MLRPAHLLACLPLLLPAPLWSQSAVDVERGELRRLTTDDGLPQGFVRDILQDRQGHLWFSTKDGLARSDGYTMTVFRHDDGDSTSISGDHATHLLEDGTGHLWVGIKGRGLDRYDPRRERFTAVRYGEGITPGHYVGIDVLTLGPDGQLWTVSEDKALSVVVTDSAGPPVMRLPSHTYPEFTFPAQVTHAAGDQQGGLWLVTDRSLHRLVLVGTERGMQHELPLPSPTMDHDARFHGHQLVLEPKRDRMWALLSAFAIAFDVRTGSPIDTLHLPAAHQIHRLGTLDREGMLWYEDKFERSCRLSLRTARCPCSTCAPMGTMPTRTCS